MKTWVLLVLSLTACSGQGRMHLGRSSNVKASVNESSEETGWSPAPAAPAATSASSSEPAAAPPQAAVAITNTPAAAEPPPPRPTGCAFVCTDSHRNRVSKETSEAIGNALAGELATMRSCGRESGPAKVTLRFDSTSALTHFGVDDELGGPCLDALRSKRPAVTYQGPATLRCAERCGR